MSDIPKENIDRVLQIIDEFEARCEEASFTDSGETWDVLTVIYELLGGNDE